MAEIDHGPQIETKPAARPEPTKMTLRELLALLGELALPEWWKLTVVVLGAVSGIFSAGMWWQNQSVAPPASDLVRCDQADGYPLGLWLVSGNAYNNEKPPRPIVLASSVRFTSKTTGTLVAADEIERVDGVFRLNREPSSRESLDYVFEAKNGYVSRWRPTVSEDGCSMTGDFDDTDKNAGTFTMIWRGRENFYVKK
jgi:hypothetical protein